MIVQGGIDFPISYEQDQEAFQAAKLKVLKSKLVTSRMKTTVYFTLTMVWFGKENSLIG